MAEKVAARAIIARALGERKMETVHLAACGDDELVVDMVATGVCHTDLVELGSVYPLVQGHEGRAVPQGSGYVRSVGKNVTVAEPGDPVLLSFTICKSCHFCETGHPAHCVAFGPLNFSSPEKKFEAAEGPITGSFFGQSSFSSTSVVKETSVVNVKGLVKDVDELKLLAPLGCGIQTGYGTTIRVAKATKDDSVVVCGLGGVGLSALMSAKIIGCKTIIAVDIVEARLALAKELGAHITINSAKLEEGVSFADKVREATDGHGSSISIDTTGILAVVDQVQDFTRPRGKVVLIAAYPMEQQLSISPVHYVLTGKQLLGAIEGDSIPSQCVPEMIGHWRKGDLPIEKLVKFFPADQFEDAIVDMTKGGAIKPVLVW